MKKYTSSAQHRKRATHANRRKKGTSLACCLVRFAENTLIIVERCYRSGWIDPLPHTRGFIHNISSVRKSRQGSLLGCSRSLLLHLLLIDGASSLSLRLKQNMPAACLRAKARSIGNEQKRDPIQSAYCAAFALGRSPLPAGA